VACALQNYLGNSVLVGYAIDRLPYLGSRVAYAKQAMRDKLIPLLAPGTPEWGKLLQIHIDDHLKQCAA